MWCCDPIKYIAGPTALVLIIQPVKKARMTSHEKLIWRSLKGLINVSTKWSTGSTKRGNILDSLLRQSPTVMGIVRTPNSNGTCQ